ncbi:MAG: molybdopterin-dependent oxidoreductase [Desulfotomaculaceae bacterium]|nr:molybdopterin-dependent oxidoreductase [Desulfotomaculaceae bacterium]
MTKQPEQASENCAFTLDQAKAVAQEAGEQVVPTYCAMCGPNPTCGIYAFVKDGRFTRVAGMAESPLNKGGVCPKGHAAPQWVYSPDRLRKPLLRKGAKGEGVFQEISWDEAISVIADRLRQQKVQYGPESLAILSPARRSYSDFIQRFLIAHGSPNYGHSGICFVQREFAFSYTIGGQPRCDYKNADLIVLWGRQPIYSGPAMGPARDLVAAKRRGAKIIAIKPSVEPDVGMADIWAPLRPGTDAALALSMLNVIIGENLIDAPFVEAWCYGYEQLRAHIRKYPPEWGERISGVPAGQIQEIARLYATTRAATIDLGNGVEHAPSSSDAIRSVAILMAITGHLDRPGGNLLGGGRRSMPSPKTVNLADRYTQEMVDKLVGPELPKVFQPFWGGTSSAYYRILDSVLTKTPYPIRTIIAPGTQPTVSNRGSKRVVEALKKVDFYVVLDVTRTADMNYADIVLPVSTPYESDHPFESRGNWIMARNQVIEPLGDYKSMYEFFLDLGVQMGYGADFWNGSITDCQNYQLSPFGLTIEELREYPVGLVYDPKGNARSYENYSRIFKRRSNALSHEPYLPQGKVAIYNTTFEREGYNPLPEWREPPESITGTPELAKKYPLILSDYHTSKVYSASWQRNVPYLREIQPFPTLHIHPATAAARKINDQDWIIVESPHGWMKVKAELYPGIRPDTVMILHGWWQGCRELGFDDMPILDGGANVNNMYSVDPDQAFDPLITAMSSQTLVEVRKYEP